MRNSRPEVGYSASWGMPSHQWSGEELHEPHATDSTLKSALCVGFLIVCQMKIHIIFVLNFRISYLKNFLPSPIYGSSLPHPWIFHFERSHIQEVCT